MDTVAIKTSSLSKRHGVKSVPKKKVARIRNREGMPPRQYDNFQSAIEDVKAGRIYRLDIETFAEDIKKEIKREK
jgi:hypothetical protein